MANPLAPPVPYEDVVQQQAKIVANQCNEIVTSRTKLSFGAFDAFMRAITGGAPDGELGSTKDKAVELRDRWTNLQFLGVDAYELVKEAAQVFLMCGGYDPPARDGRRSTSVGGGTTHRAETTAERDYTLDGANESETGEPHGEGNGNGNPPTDGDIREAQARAASAQDQVMTLLKQRLQHSPYYSVILERVGRGPSPLVFTRMVRPTFELIHSYWLEEGLLAQTMNAVAMRFQNRGVNGAAQALARLEIEPLRPLASLLWGFIETEQHRLSVRRRAYEYAHEYGLSLHGRAVGSLRPADPRTQFLQAFHNLLAKCVRYYEQRDDRQIDADPFPVLNGLREVQLILGEGAHNQFGELPLTARADMLVQQWILAQPEMDRFLGGRPMAPYPERWMDRVDSMKAIMGWPDTSVLHFADLSSCGEQLLLSIRNGPWATLDTDRAAAGTWADTLRSRVQTYVHAYRAVTGVDIQADAVAGRRSDATLPSVHLARRLAVRVAR
jgi:hypothetical protein